ncbi:WD repeat-containing protein [Acrasis kona]|uniref:WD repeat-containing protein n=1 Tax=Acrasis kona TaxID=1008807 RepID=A0AAW2Z8S9_9EUKA
MWIYLSKKIAIPKDQKLYCVSWNGEQGWIACGGDGLLKVLKLESIDDGKQQKGIAAPNNLTMNQTLEGHHKAKVQVVCWNDCYRKLTSSDDKGRIVVWQLYKGTWHEEMVNARNKSVVKDMKWTADGMKICIIYEDGAVIVGSVDGSRLWGKDLKTALSRCEWSPDGKFLLFGSMKGNIHIFDSKSGSRLMSMKITCISDLPNPSLELSSQPNAQQPAGEQDILVGIVWYNGIKGYADPNSPSLAVCYINGWCQLMRSEVDENPVLLDTGMTISQAQWNSNGTILAIAGSQEQPVANEPEVKSPSSIVQFYTPYGHHLKSLKVPGTNISSLSWEGTGLRIALAVDVFVYFANVRPDYKWAYFNKTLAYCFTKVERPEHCVVFWNTKTGEKNVKYIKRLISIRGHGDFCVIATKTDGANDTKYALIMCNSIGSPVESKYIPIEPIYLAMTECHVIIASDKSIMIWQYKAQYSKQSDFSMAMNSALRTKEEIEYIFDIDDVNIKPVSSTQDKLKLNFKSADTTDTICAIYAHNESLFVARVSGLVHQYSTLPNVQLISKFILKCRPQMISASCDSKKISVIDINGIFSLHKLNTSTQLARKKKLPVTEVESLNVERKEVWDMRWSEDNPDLFAIMEKTKMYTFRGVTPEEPVMSSAYICDFNNLMIKAVLLDEIMMAPDKPSRDHVLKYETRSLRDTKEILRSVSIDDALVFIKDNPHPRLWKLLATASLEKLDFNIAYKAFIQCADYQGVQFVKRIRELDDRNKQLAEVAAHFKKTDEAEKIYTNIDRKDLAIEMRMQAGDWFGVLQLLRDGTGDDTQLATVHDKIGEYYADRQQWTKALQHYKKSDNFEKLIQIYYLVEDFKSLEKLIDTLPERSNLLVNIGDQFVSVGICEHAVTAYLKAGETKSAIDCCVELNQWDRAVQLAEKYNVKEIEDILYKYANHLVDKNKIPEAIELYQKANRNTESAKLLTKVAREVGRVKLQPMKAKMLYVMAALEIETNKKRLLDQNGESKSTASALQGLMQHDSSTGFDKNLDNSWHGAEAYHYYMLAQRQLSEENLVDALNTSLRLTEYEDVLGARELYSVLALTGYFAHDFKTCSRAFMKLETLQGSDEDKIKFQSLAVDIFTKYPPRREDQSPKNECPQCKCEASDYESHCSHCGTPFYGCVVTGRNIFVNEFWRCNSCKHRAFDHVVYKYKNCPMCHAERS